MVFILTTFSTENMRKLNLKGNHRLECLARCTKVAKLSDSLPWFVSFTFIIVNICSVIFYFGSYNWMRSLPGC